jgi:hypothetical protein
MPDETARPGALDEVKTASQALAGVLTGLD